MTEADRQVLHELQAGQSRIEGKLDELLQALTEDTGAPVPQRTLEGDSAGAERDQGQSLDTGD